VFLLYVWQYKKKEKKREETTYIGQGPFCTQILADYGAKVLKVENPKGGVWNELLFNHNLNSY
jgi:hypothetical protein